MLRGMKFKCKVPTSQTFTMADFFSTDVDEIDFDRAASAFPDISLDGGGGIPVQFTSVRSDSTAGFSFDEPTTIHNVKVTGDDELEKFQTEFPDIQVCLSPAGLVCAYTYNTPSHNPLPFNRSLPLLLLSRHVHSHLHIRPHLS